jgi:hypothetical protein
MKPILYIEPSLANALKIKIEKGCPHIHLSVEEECDAFTAALLWLEVLDRGFKTSLEYGLCVVSFEQRSNLYSLSKEDRKLISSMEKRMSSLAEKVEVVRDAKI